MPQLSTADHSVSPPRVKVPRDYNAAHDLIQRNLQAGRGAKAAFIDDAGSTTYGELAERANRFGNVLAGLGLEQESRIMLCLLDTIDFPTAFLGSIQAGVVPIAANTLLTAADYDFMLGDSRASALIVSEALWPQFEAIVGKHKHLKHVIVSGSDAKGRLRLADLMAKASAQFEPASTTADDMCFWLYSSGSTGAPKGTVHSQANLYWTALLYGQGVLGLDERDVCFSAAKLFFAYGLGNALTFPLWAGASVLLMAERPTPDAVFARWCGRAGPQPTVFFGAPTGYAGMMAAPALPARGDVALRLCSSAGEALPRELGERFEAHFGCEVIDGIGSTEMLHIFISNRPGDVHYGSTGKAVPGYEIELRGDDGRPVPDGEVGDLYIAGPSAALMYWANSEKSRSTFQGAWTKSGDKYLRNADGTYTYGGRSDDMLKVSGQYVSPFEVEATLMQHAAVLEAAVIGVADAEGLTRAKAFVVLKPGHDAGALHEELKAFVKSRLAPFKYPRQIEFLPELPKTATGKIQRFRLRELEAAKGAS